MTGASIKNSHSFFSQYFRQSRPLNQVILMTILIEKIKIKSIVSRVRSNSFYWAFKDVDPRLIGILSNITTVMCTNLHKLTSCHRNKYYVWYQISRKVTLNIIYNFELYITHWKLMLYTLYFSTLGMPYYDNQHRVTLSQLLYLHTHFSFVQETRTTVTFYLHSIVNAHCSYMWQALHLHDFMQCMFAFLQPHFTEMYHLVHPHIITSAYWG